MIWLLVLAAAGAAIVLVMSHVASPLRALFPPPIGLKGLGEGCRDPKTGRPVASLLGCCLCTGFWTGVFFAFLAVPTLEGAFNLWYMKLGFVVAFAFASSVVAYVLGTWLREHDREHK